MELSAILFSCPVNGAEDRQDRGVVMGPPLSVGGFAGSDEEPLLGGAGFARHRSDRSILATGARGFISRGRAGVRSCQDTYMDSNL